MKKIKITVMRIARYRDLMERYENPIQDACDMQVGQVFFADTRESDWYIPHSESMVSISRNISTSKAESDIR